MKKWVKFEKRKGACENLLQVVWKYSDCGVDRLYLEDYWIGYLPPEFYSEVESKFKKVWLKNNRDYLQARRLTCMTVCITPNDGIRSDSGVYVLGIGKFLEDVVQAIERREHEKFKTESKK
ncbi:MAG: hypothetical protein IJF84_13430 [Thermoguttaceae bacterium]|nr:hypothetical protein [Thermoguttaceae bacterium]